MNKAPTRTEPAIAHLRVDGTRDRDLVLDTDEGAASVCGQWIDATSRVTRVFTGRCVITDAARAGVTAVDT